MAVTVEGNLKRKLVVAAVLSILAVAAFVAGQAAARNVQAGGSGELAMTGSGGTPVATSRPDRERATAGSSATFEDRATVVAIADPLETLRFVALPGLAPLIAAETEADLNNSVGLDMTALGYPGTAAVVADLVVIGPPGSTVSVHPGDRPADALRFTVPSAGRLLVPHLVAATDSEGRVVVAADDQVRVEMSGIGRYVEAGRARAGRFVPTGSQRIGSLVTATDGRRLVMVLSDALGDDAELVGQAVVRLNANVSPDGGSVSVGSGPPIPWPGPARRDTGLAGTELLTVTPNDEGEIVMDYLGGSVMTVDLVGYYTNERAPESAAGLLVLAERPELQTVEVEGGDVAIDAATSGGGPGLVTVEVANGATGGSISFWGDRDPVPTSPAFALAPDQRRSTTEWLAPAPDTTTIRAPEGASLRIWTVGAYT